MLAVDSISRKQSSLFAHYLYLIIKAPIGANIIKVEMVEIESTSELGIPDESTVHSLSFSLKSLSIE